MAWAFAPDEALIVEAPLPKCRYWSVLLTDPLYATLDWVNNQASLNRSQARVDADGKIRVVIAHSDPGVPNWLDTVDHPRGGLQWRWMGCDSAPTPTVKRVALSQVRANLLQILRSALEERSVFVWIGDENPSPELRSVSVVGANYGLGYRNLGTVGVVGPLRMDYATAIDSVRDAAGRLSKFFETVYEG